MPCLYDGRNLFLTCLHVRVHFCAAGGEGAVFVDEELDGDKGKEEADEDPAAAGAGGTCPHPAHCSVIINLWACACDPNAGVLC